MAAELGREPRSEDDHEAAEALLKRMRLGLLLTERVQAAAGLRHPPALLLFPKTKQRFYFAEALALFDKRERCLIVCDCVEEVLVFLESAEPGNRAPRRAVELVRAFVDERARVEELRRIHSRLVGMYPKRDSNEYYEGPPADSPHRWDVIRAAFYLVSEAFDSKDSAESALSFAARVPDGQIGDDRQRRRLIQALLS